jgi:hypothetical protein
MKNIGKFQNKLVKNNINSNKRNTCDYIEQAKTNKNSNRTKQDINQYIH